MANTREIDSDDKAYILNWMTKNCKGHRNALTRPLILPHIQGVMPHISDRYFRQIIHTLRREKLIASRSDIGYWYIVSYISDPLERMAEVEALLLAELELMAKGTDLIESARALKERRIEMGVTDTQVEILF